MRFWKRKPRLTQAEKKVIALTYLLEERLKRLTPAEKERFHNACAEMHQATTINAEDAIKHLCSLVQLNPTKHHIDQ